MGRSVRIPKEKLLQTGLEMIIKDGYSSINITSLAREAGCSTQPVAWHFGNMENFRKELAAYAQNYVNEKMRSDTKDPLMSFLHTGKVIIDMAFDEPKLVSFIRLSESGTEFSEGTGFVFDDKRNAALASDIARKFGIPESAAAGFMQAAMVYTHGLSTLISTGLLSCEKSGAYKMLTDFGVVYLKGLGVPESIAEKAYD
ncbi:MAG: TetR/AcrR family transcriptional regulator [Oscillospiraceae bacterium]|nr:TetR/AcrR family transcriptional regulator [Oscillospiraceae bacterium]